MLQFDLKLTKELLSHLGNLAHTGVQLFDENFEGTYACTEPGSAFCNAVKCHYADRCVMSDTNALRAAKTGDEDGFHYKCHFGMTETVLKLHRNNVIYGYIISGPLRAEKDEAFALEQIRDYSTKFGVDEQTMLQAYYATSEFTEEKYQAIRDLSFAIFEYAVNKNLITIKHNVFENAIAPYIKANLDKPLDSATLCEVLNMSEKQIYSAVVRATGVPPKKYITAQRMLAARELVQTTDEPLTTIADKVGVHDYNYFGKIFRSTFGHAPSYYRNKHKSD